MRLVIQGTSASRGLVLGRARVREPHRIEVEQQNIGPERVEAEIARLDAAIAAAREELAGLRRQLQGALLHELGDFLDLHDLLLDDPELLNGLRDLVGTGRYAAETALQMQRDRLAKVFGAMDDPYFRSRQEDIDHVIGRVYAALHRSHGEQPAQAGDIVVAENLAPTEVARLVEQGVVAVVTALGSPLSHTAILARSLHLPLVVGAHEAIERINDGDLLIVDAGSGEVLVEPAGEDLDRFQRRSKELDRERRSLQRLRRKPTRTLDGHEIRLFANAESAADAAEALSLDAAGIGLYRSEFLFLQGEGPPDEEQQFLAYRELVERMDGRPVTIRTLDLGADKADRFGLSLPGEDNPALGLRGLRLTLAQPGVFRVQLRAILRAAVAGPVRILLPMVSRREELVAARELVRQARVELDAEGLEAGTDVTLGAMIEVPSAALAVDTLVDQVDFLSIGTNDLVQYLMAADRGNDAVADLHSPLQPAVLRLLAQVVRTGSEAGVPVSVCGEMAAEPAYTRLLLALGLTELSLHPSSLLEVRRMVRDSDRGRLRRRLRSLLAARDRDAIARWLDRD